MSYILDALKKSEQERQRGTTPGLQTIQAPEWSTATRRPIWPWVVGIALMLNAGLLAWWLSPWQAHKQGPSTPPAQTAAQPAAPQTSMAAVEPALPKPPSSSPPVSVESQAKTDSSQATAPTSQKAAESRAPDPPKSEVSDAAKAAEGSASLPGGAVAPTQTAQLAKNAPAKAPTPPKPAAKHETSPPGAHPSPQAVGAPDPGEAKAEQDGSKRSAPTASASATPPAKPAAAQDAKPGRNEMKEAALIQDLQPLLSETRPDRKEPDYHQIPPALKSTIPKIRLSFLIYSENASERRVTINGKALREGDEISEDLKLERITPDGAVLVYKGYRFHKGVF